MFLCNLNKSLKTIVVYSVYQMIICIYFVAQMCVFVVAAAESFNEIKKIIIILPNLRSHDGV